MAIHSVGSNAAIALGEETLWASGTVAVTRGFPFLSEGVALSREVQATNAIRGASARSIWRTGKTTVGGDISVEVVPNSAGIFTLIKHALGRCVTAGPSGGGFYTHRIMCSGVLPEGLRVEIDREAATFTYAGMKVQQMSMQCKVGDPLSATFTMLGKSETAADGRGTQGLTISTLNPLTYDEGGLYMDGSATAAEITGFTLQVNNNLVEDKCALGSAERIAIPRTGFREVTGSLTSEFGDLINYNKFVNGTESAIKLKFVSDDVCDGAGQEYELAIDLPRIVFTGNTPNVGGPELIYHDLPYIAFASSTGGYDECDEVRMTLTTDVSAV